MGFARANTTAPDHQLRPSAPAHHLLHIRGETSGRRNHRGTGARHQHLQYYGRVSVSSLWFLSRVFSSLCAERVVQARDVRLEGLEQASACGSPRRQQGARAVWLNCCILYPQNVSNAAVLWAHPPRSPGVWAPELLHATPATRGCQLVLEVVSNLADDNPNCGGGAKQKK